MNQRHLLNFILLTSAISRIRPLYIAYNLAAFAAQRLPLREDEMPPVADRMNACASSISSQGTPQQWATAYRANMGVAILNTYLFRRMTPDWIGRRIHLQGEDQLHAALARKKGILVLASHQHHLVFLSASIGLLGLRTNPILLDPKITTPDYLAPYMGRMIGDSERHFSGGRYLIVDLKNQYIRQIYRALERNEIVISANDFPNDLAPKRRVELPFLNKQISIPYGSIKIALEHSAQIMTAFLHWRGGDQFVLNFSLIEATTVEEACAAYSKHLEHAVGVDPGGWEGWKWARMFQSETNST